MKNNRPKVLLVEDSDTIAALASGQLARFNLDFDRVRNGSEAVEAARRCNYDMILMDIQMPTLDGFKATIQIRDNERVSGSQRSQIFGVTASENRSDCTDAGMDGYFRKPANYVHIIQACLPACGLAA